MDVSPQLLREVEFREQWRGYNPDEVDDFLERVATALEQLQDRLRETAERAARAERRATESDDNGELRRTLVLAQRTADAAVAEANEEAARLRAEAEEQAGTLLAEARAQAEQLTGDAEERAAVELGNLTERRRALEADVEALTAYVSEQRRRLADDLRAQLQWLDDPERGLAPPPELQGVSVPAPAEPVVEEEPAPWPNGEAADETQIDEQPRPEADERLDPPPAFDSNGGGVRRPVPEPPDDDDSVLAEAAADDPFLAELRRAVIDPEPLGPRPDVGDEVYEDEPVGGLFRRRHR